MNAWPDMITRAVRSHLRPRIGRSRDLSRSWAASIVRVLLGGVEHARHELINDGEEGPGPVGHDLSRLAVSAQRRREEPSRSLGVAPGGDVDIDDLAVLVDRPVDVAPPSRATFT